MYWNVAYPHSAKTHAPNDSYHFNINYCLNSLRKVVGKAYELVNIISWEI